MKRKIYLASSWKNQYFDKVFISLRNEGYEIYNFRNPSPNNYGFSWSKIDQEWKRWNIIDYLRILDNPLCNDAFKLDFEAMNWADTCILLLPSGRSAHLEAGYMKGQGKQTYVYIPEYDTPDLMYKLCDNVLIKLSDLLLSLKSKK